MSTAGESARLHAVAYAFAAVQSEPNSHAVDPDADEESAAFIRRWLDLAKAVIRRDRPDDEDPVEAPAK